MKSYFNLIIIFSLTIYAALQGKPVIQRVQADRRPVAQYEKFEVRLALTADFNNPFDPEDIDLTATFTSPAGKEWKVSGFYCTGGFGSQWMVRFSPDETGRWKYQISVHDRQGQTVSDPDTFKVIASKHHGPIYVSTVNNRYLQYADGTPFYGVGLWYNDNYQRFNDGQIKPEELDHLKELGVNFISTYITPIETMATGVGRYDQNLCGRLDEVLKMCEDRELLSSLNIWFHAFLSETVWPGGNRRWQTNPYQSICKAKDFYSSSKAWTYQEKMYRYLIARWGYSRALAIWFIIDEVNGTDGWVSGDSLGAAKWGKKVHDYFKTHDPYGRPTTGTRSGGFFEFWHEGYQTFDLAAREIYEAQGFPILRDGKIDSGDTHPLKLSYMNYINEIRKLWNGYQKPAILGETGWDHTFYEPGMPGYLALYHNALWGCLASGTAMTPFWWSFGRFVNDNVLTHQLASFSQFVARIPFSQLTHLNPAEAKLSNGDAFAIKSDQLTFGWVVNPESDVAGAVVVLSSMPAGDYNLQIYHTWRGRFVNEEKVKAVDGHITFTIPALKIEEGHARYIGQDAAFVLKPIE